MGDHNPGRPRPGEVEGGLSPVRAFFILGAVLAAITVWFFATRDATPASPTAQPSRSPDYSLTDAEAIAEFERLNSQLLQAYEERNIALAEEVFTSDSPMLPRVRKEIDDLIDSGVLSRTSFRERRTDIVLSSSARIVLEREEILYPNFETESGADATGASTPERRVVRWELRQDASRWLLHDGTVIDRDVIERRRR